MFRNIFACLPLRPRQEKEKLHFHNAGYCFDLPLSDWLYGRENSVTATEKEFISNNCKKKTDQKIQRNLNSMCAEYNDTVYKYAPKFG
jgi:hypothetical protein